MDIKIAITNLAAYNSGHLVFEWVELPSPDINADIQRVLSADYPGRRPGQADEEAFISDYEAPWKIEEHESIHNVNEMAEEFEALDSYEQQRAAFCLYEGYSFEEAMDEKDNVWVYPAENDRELGEFLVDDGYFGDFPAEHPLSAYVDYEAIGRDFRINNGIVFNPDGLEPGAYRISG